MSRERLIGRFCPFCYIQVTTRPRDPHELGKLIAGIATGRV